MIDFEEIETRIQDTINKLTVSLNVESSTICRELDNQINDLKKIYKDKEEVLLAISLVEKNRNLYFKIKENFINHLSNVNCLNNVKK